MHQRRLISYLLIYCLTFSQVAQAYSQAWLPHRPVQHRIERTDTIGRSANAEHDISIAAMGNVNIAAATDTWGSDHYDHEITNGWQAKHAFSITNHGPETTNKARTDGTNDTGKPTALSTIPSSITAGNGLHIHAGVVTNTTVGGTQTSNPANSNSTGVITVPTGGLYTLHPGQNYLVVTDARFTNYQQGSGSGLAIQHNRFLQQLDDDSLD